MNNKLNNLYNYLNSSGFGKEDDLLDRMKYNIRETPERINSLSEWYNNLNAEDLEEAKTKFCYYLKYDLVQRIDEIPIPIPDKPPFVKPLEDTEE